MKQKKYIGWLEIKNRIYVQFDSVEEFLSECGDSPCATCFVQAICLQKKDMFNDPKGRNYWVLTSKTCEALINFLSKRHFSLNI